MVTVIEDPRLLVTVSWHELTPHGEPVWSCTSRKPSIGKVVRLGRFEKITLPVEVTATDHSALMLASHPSMLSVSASALHRLRVTL